MSSSFRCPECGSPNPVFSAMNQSILAITGELSIGPALEKIASVGRSLIHASYAAIGVREGQSFSRFIVSGMTADDIAAAGPLPPTHGLLWEVLVSGRPLRSADVERHPGFEGWSEHHPAMRSLLGVPIVARDAVIGAFYLANENTWGFSQDDQDVIEMLATHAGIAIENARLYEQSRELSVVQERNRLARELHDSVTQMLFSIALTTETALTLLEDDSEQAKLHLKRLSGLAADAQREMRSLIFELRPADVDLQGLPTTLEKHVDVLRSVYPIEIELDCDDVSISADIQGQLFRIVQEALNNAVKHSSARRVRVDVRAQPDRLVARVHDDGAGFDVDSAARRTGHLGLISMRERAASMGASFDIASSAGRGTTVTLVLPISEASA